ncbi:probable WRKY transcription factor 51 [Triticum dicoccoides]|uniref:probable WRKY transcription factor 51 n=1 Tax=Triticum dicoccoides TaxID=85692 RepID=UPI00188E9814|nr:probable WRKY transcription factor 51 [Triticum dicoccoides]
MAAVGAAPLLFQQQAQAVGDGCYFSFMSSYFSHGEVSSNASSPASSFSAALGATPPAAPAIAADPAAQFDISEYLFDEGVFSESLPPVISVPAVGVAAASSASAVTARSAESVERPRTERIAFRTRSEIEILDDGYKWRKYGKKSVKNSPNPRNYYRCSTEGCSVKKRVERDRDDQAYVVTTYEGTHSHVSPSTVYYASQDAASGRFFVAGTHPPPGSLN